MFLARRFRRREFRPFPRFDRPGYGLFDETSYPVEVFFRINWQTVAGVTSGSPV